MSGQYIFTMHGLEKTIDHKKIIKGINLSFFPGAKIGVLGPNGAGKSTVLRIMAGVDDKFEGHAQPAEGISVGYVPQEPQLDNSKTVRDNVRAGAVEMMALLEEYDDINNKLGEVTDPDEMEKLLNRSGDIYDKIDAGGGFELDRFVEAMVGIRQEIAALERGESDKADNLLKNAPHTSEEVCGNDWTHPYTREQAAFPVAVNRDWKYWPGVSRVDNAYGDRNLICTCPPIEEYATVEA